MIPLRVATFNTLYPNALEQPGMWTRRSELIRRAIERARPAVIGLQEVLPATLAELPRLLGGLSFVAGPDHGPPTAFSPSMVHWVRFAQLENAESLLVMNAHIGHAPWHHALAVRTITERIGEREGSLYASDHHLTLVEFSAQ